MSERIISDDDKLPLSGIERLLYDVDEVARMYPEVDPFKYAIRRGKYRHNIRDYEEIYDNEARAIKGE